MAFTYSRQADLDELNAHLKELQLPKGKELRTLKELKNGVFDNTQKISAVEKAIAEHESVKITEEAAYNANYKAIKQLEVKKFNYPLSVELVEALERVLEIGQSVKSGYGYSAPLDFEVALGTKQSELKTMISQAKKAVYHLEQFKD
jgi:hypothetical protein